MLRESQQEVLDLKHELNVVRHQLQTEQAHADSMKLKAEEAVRTAAAKVALLTRELDDARAAATSQQLVLSHPVHSLAPSPSPGHGARGPAGGTGGASPGAARPPVGAGSGPALPLMARHPPERLARHRSRRPPAPHRRRLPAAAPLAVGDADGSSMHAAVLTRAGEAAAVRALQLLVCLTRREDGAGWCAQPMPDRAGSATLGGWP